MTYPDPTRRDLLRAIRARLPSAEQQFPVLVLVTIVLTIIVLWTWEAGALDRWMSSTPVWQVSGIERALEWSPWMPT